MAPGVEGTTVRRGTVRPLDITDAVSSSSCSDRRDLASSSTLSDDDDDVFCSASSTARHGLRHRHRRTHLPRPSGRWIISVIFVVIFVMTQVRSSRSFPLHRNGRRTSPSNSALLNTVHYLTKYGYLPQSDLETGNLRTGDQLREAIRTMQRFGNIPHTGELDDATRRLMERPRCGNLDIIPDSTGFVTNNRVRRYALQGVKWQKTDLTWSVGTYTTSLSQDVVREELTKALHIWSEASKLTFNEVASGMDVQRSDQQQVELVHATPAADIIVSFYRRFHGDGYAFDGQGAVLAHAFFPGEGRGGDTHFDDDEHWISGLYNSDDGVSLLSVAAHEFGHSLGLSHSSVPDALMFPYYQGLKPNFKLPYDDMMGIQQLYGARDERPWATLNPDYVTPPSHVPSPATTSPTRRPPTTSTPRTRPTKRPRPTTRPPATDKPDTCDTSYDAISVIRHEIFVFKGRYFWRLDDRGLSKDYPVEIERFWYNLPANMTHIDALYERPQDKKIVFFIGKEFWVFHANQPMPNYPKPLTVLGLPEEIERIDAAMVWGHNSKTYLFSGTMYWRLDEDEELVELDYPRDMSMWGGVDYNIDAAFQWTDGRTYFFKGKAFWKFNDQLMRVENVAPILSGPFWMGCPDRTVDPNVPEEGRKRIGGRNGGGGMHSASAASTEVALTDSSAASGHGCRMSVVVMIFVLTKTVSGLSSSSSSSS